MHLPRAWWVVGFVLVAVSVCAGQTSSPQKASHPAPKTPASAKSQLPEWKLLTQQANEAERKGDRGKARALLDKAYLAAPSGEEKAQVAFQIASVCEKQKAYDEARRWYLQAIYDAPKGPLATKARERMRAIPDSRRPAAAGATSAGGTSKPKSR